jgi:DNA repair protein RadC
MIEHGPSALTDPELLAIFFGTGVPGMNAVDLGRMLMRKYETLTGVCRRTYPELRDHKGIGPAKAMNLAAAFELGRRLAKEEYNSKPLDTPKAIYELLSPQMRGLAKECLRVLLLTTRFTLLANEEIHVGTVNETLAHPRDILRPVISHGAYAFVIAHNHPSGDPTPSAADGAFTRRLREASDLLQVRLMDHIIIGQPGKANPNGYFSFREAGMF